MKVRRLDKEHDWTFGQGVSNYAKESEAISQCVKTRLWSFVNDWFLDLEHGLPWLGNSGRKVDKAELELEIKRSVLNTEGVAEITEYDASIDPEIRKLVVQIHYIDIYGNQGSVDYKSE